MDKSRKCPECGIMHQCVLEESSTGKVVVEYEKCKGCLLGFGPRGYMKDRLPQEIK